MPFTRVESLPTVARVGGGAGRPAQVHPEGDALLAEGPGTYLIETLEHDGSEDGLKAAKNKAQAISRQLKNVDTSIRVVQRNYSDAIEVYAVVMTEDEQTEYAATLEARREARAAKAEDTHGDYQSGDEDDDEE